MKQATIDVTTLADVTNSLRRNPSLVTLTDAAILARIGNGENTAQKLVEKTGHDTVYVTVLVHKYAKSKLLTSRPSKQDRRTKILTLTKKGNESIKAVEKHIRVSLSAKK